MTDQQYAPPPPGYHYGPPPQKKGLGVAAMVVGIVAISISWIPLLGLLSFILGPVAVVLGIIAFLKRWGRGQAITGIITGALGTVIVFIGFMMFGYLVDDFDRAMSEARDGAQDSEEERDEEVDADDAASAEDSSGESPEPAPQPEEGSGDDVTPMGEPVPVTDWWSGTEVGTITVDSITADFQCPQGGDVWEPESGAFIALDMTVEASSDAEESIYIEGYDFYVLDSDNQVTDSGLDSPATYDCVPDADLLDDARPGTISSGYVLLDVNVGSGTVVYEGGDEEIRWEF